MILIPFFFFSVFFCLFIAVTAVPYLGFLVRIFEFGECCNGFLLFVCLLVGSFVVESVSFNFGSMRVRIESNRLRCRKNLVVRR